MLYMKEMRPVVQSECTLKESAAINQILGRRVIISNDNQFLFVNSFSCTLPPLCQMGEVRRVMINHLLRKLYHYGVCGEWVFNWIVFHSGTAWAGRNRPSITKSREWSGRSTYKCTLTGTPGITIGSGSRKRNGNAIGRTTQVNLHGPPYSYTSPTLLCSGMHWPKTNSRNITRWPGMSGICTCRCTLTGQPEKTMPRAKRNERKRTKLGMETMVKNTKQSLSFC